MSIFNPTKIAFLSTVLAGTALLSGCATASRPPLVLSPVGPETTRALQTNPGGTLLVYSGPDTFNDNSTDVLDVYSHYSDYEIWTADGSKLLQRVHNHVLPFSDDNPVKVGLLAGHYLIKASSSRYGWVSVPVVMAAHEITTVHLDGSGGAVEKTKENADTVYLPDGEVVGPKKCKDGLSPSPAEKLN